MNCLECRELLHKRLDGEPIASDALEQHLSQCATCRDQHSGAQLLLESLKNQPKPKLPANFAQAMVAEVMRDRRHRIVKMRRRFFATMALAASVLILLALGFFWLPRSAPVDHPKKDEVVKDAPKPAPPPKDEPKVAPKIQDQPNELRDRWAGAMRDHAKVVMAAANVDKLPPVDKLPMTPGAREARKEVAVGVEAVARSTRKAFDFFARELPMPDMGEQKN
jgi:hypothetical protein